MKIAFGWMHLPSIVSQLHQDQQKDQNNPAVVQLAPEREVEEAEHKSFLLETSIEATEETTINWYSDADHF